MGFGIQMISSNEWLQNPHAQPPTIQLQTVSIHLKQFRNQNGKTDLLEDNKKGEQLMGEVMAMSSLMGTNTTGKRDAMGWAV